MQCMILSYPDHTHLFFRYITFGNNLQLIIPLMSTDEDTLASAPLLFSR